MKKNWLLVLLVLLGCSKGNDTPLKGLPQLTVSLMSNFITANRAGFSCVVTSAGSTLVFEQGICFSTSPNPTVENASVVKSSGTQSSFYSTPSIFLTGQVYYVRAYAKNSTGVGYSNEVSFKTYGYRGQAGGFVFYDKGSVSDGWRYLEVSPVDVSTSSQWGTATLITGASGSGLGGGYQNTQDMINAGLVNPSNALPTAAQAAKGYTLNGYNDWYLPSIGELDAIWGCLAQHSVGGFGANGIGYWSSTQQGQYYANYTNLDRVGGGGYNNKLAGMAVRAVRRY